MSARRAVRLAINDDAGHWIVSRSGYGNLVPLGGPLASLGVALVSLGGALNGSPVILVKFGVNIFFFNENYVFTTFL